MIYRILLVISLTSCISGWLVMNATRTSCQGEENHNATLEFMFPAMVNSSPNSLFIYCELSTDVRPIVMFRLHEGVEVPESQDEQFGGRVQCDKDVLREGRLRLHVSRLRINDSGLYMCDVLTGSERYTGKIRLNVTAPVDKPEPPTTKPAPVLTKPAPVKTKPAPPSRGRVGLYAGLGLAAAALCAGLYLAFKLSCTKSTNRGNIDAVV